MIVYFYFSTIAILKSSGRIDFELNLFVTLISAFNSKKSMKHPIQYNRNLKPFARKLRIEGTKGEAILWFYALKARKMYGYQFNRQFPIGNYVVDFICRKLNLIIEIDGSSHLSKSESDRIRQDYLEVSGYEILRFTEAEVVHRLDDVVEKVSYAVESLEKNH
jgi:very-short-patch-repair endonuclease